MKKFVLLLFLIVASVVGFVLPKPNNGLVFNKPFNVDTVEELWRNIRSLDQQLDVDTPIYIYMSSNGGDSQATVILLERIAKLKKRGRKFIGVVYGYCYSACGSLFASMNKRYMTRNAIYLQHLSYSRYPNATNDEITRLLDNYRLIHDASMINRSVPKLRNILKSGDLILPTKMMLQLKFIDGIVEQPDIDSI